MKRTKILSPKEYGSFTSFDKTREIEKLVNKEDLYLWSQRKEKVIIPRYIPPKVEKLNAGIFNMVRQFLP